MPKCIEKNFGLKFFNSKFGNEKLADNFPGYVFSIHKKEILSVQFTDYYSVQSICKYFGFNHGTLSFRFQFSFLKLRKLEFNCLEITNNITKCKTKIEGWQEILKRFKKNFLSFFQGSRK